MKPIDLIIIAAVLGAAWFLVFRRALTPATSTTWSGAPITLDGNVWRDSSGAGQFYGPDINPTTGAYVPPSV